jgi:hypothetical protein
VYKGDPTAGSLVPHAPAHIRETDVEEFLDIAPQWKAGVACKYQRKYKRGGGRQCGKSGRHSVKRIVIVDENKWDTTDAVQHGFAEEAK